MLRKSKWVKFDLSTEATRAFLNNGIRAVSIPTERKKGSMLVGTILLTRTKKLSILDEVLAKYKTKWEGSYKVLAIYETSAGYVANLFMAYEDDEKIWEPLRELCEKVLGFRVTLRAD